MRFRGWAVELTAVLSMGFLIVPAGARAGVVEIDPSAAISANVSASVAPGTSAGDAQTNSDTGGLSKPSIAVSATARLIGDKSAPDWDATGAANASLVHSSDQFEITGGTSAQITPVSDFTTPARVQSVTSVDFPFSLAGPSGALNYSFEIHTLVLRNEKITLLLDRAGETASSLFNQVFDASASGSVDDLSAGRYRLRVIAGSEATNLGSPGEHGSTQFTVSISAGGQGNEDDDSGGAVIPLPPGVQTGAVALGAVFVGLALFRRRTIT